MCFASGERETKCDQGEAYTCRHSIEQSIVYLHMISIAAKLCSFVNIGIELLQDRSICCYLSLIIIESTKQPSVDPTIRSSLSFPYAEILPRTPSHGFNVSVPDFALSSGFPLT